MKKFYSLFFRPKTELLPMKVKTVNPEFSQIPKDNKYIQEMSEIKKSLEGVLTSKDIIKDTFKKDYTVQA